MLNKTKVTIDEMKKLELDILRYLKKICEDNNIRYYLAGGTLLGAVRHKGFIPWDDDIDISVPREDFNKLMNILSKENKYSLISPFNQKCFYQFAKLCDKRTRLVETAYPFIEGMGVYVDIFPLDGFPSDEAERLLYVNQLNKKWYDILACYMRTKDFARLSIVASIKRMLKAVYIFIKGKNRARENLYNEIEKYDYETSEYVGFALTQYKDRFIFKREYFDSSCLLEFEGELFSCPSCWNQYLSDLYGDYMSFPPIEKQVPHHEFDVYWILE